MNDKKFGTSMIPKKIKACVDFKDVVNKFRYVYNNLDYKPNVMHKLGKFEALGSFSRVKIHFFTHMWTFSTKI